MNELLAIVLASAVSVGLARAFRIPVLPVFVLSGVALGGIFASGSIGPIRFGEAMGLGAGSVREDAATLGLAFVLFAAGLQLDPSRIGGHRKAVIGVGGAQFFALALIGFASGRSLGFDLVASCYFALMLGASSTIVGVQILTQSRRLHEPIGRVVVGVLLFQDLLMIVGIGVLSGVGDGPIAVVRASAVTVGLCCVAIFGLRVLIPKIIRVFDMDQETLLLVAIAILFAFCGVAHSAGLPIAVGAFLAGVSLSGFPVGASIRTPIGSVATFFTAVFFVALGSLLPIPDLQSVLYAMIFGAIVIVVTPVVVVLASLRLDLSRRAAIEAGLILAQAGELAIVLALFGHTQDALNDTLLAAMAFVTVGTMMLTPLIATEAIAWRLLGLIPVKLPAPTDRSGHAVMLGCGSNSRVLLDLLLLSGLELVVIDEDPAVIARLRERGVTAIRGEAADVRVLAAAGAQAAKVVVSTIPRPSVNLRVLQHLPPGRLIVRVFEAHDERKLRHAGAITASEAEAAAEEAARLILKA